MGAHDYDYPSSDYPSVGPISYPNPEYRRGAPPPKSGAFFLVLIGFFVGAIGFAALKYLGPNLDPQAAPLPQAAAQPPPPMASAIPTVSAPLRAPPIVTASMTAAPGSTPPITSSSAPTPKKKAPKAPAPPATAVPSDSVDSRQ